jgi:bleomycin hydrolase
MLVVCH